jgi:hypothetical protein
MRLVFGFTATSRAPCGTVTYVAALVAPSITVM